MRRHRSSAMRRGIAVVALPRLDEKSLSRTSYLFATVGGDRMQTSLTQSLAPGSGRVITNNPGYRPGLLSLALSI
jgi:hypothetical protein